MRPPPAPPRHRAGERPPERGGRRVAVRTRPRYGRIAAIAGALVVTGVSVVAGIATAADGGRSPAAVARPAGFDVPAAGGDGVAAVARASGALTGPESTPASTTALPEGSGNGRRVVFDESAQRVWLVDGSGDVERTYLVSGSLTDNLQPGTYEVYSRSRWAVGIDDSGVMEYFVRFTRGENAAIGFHTIPTKLGTPLQTEDQLGTPQSHGCIRQATPDAMALWDFAPEGTTVVVVA